MAERTIWHNETMQDYKAWKRNGFKERLRPCHEEVNDLVTASLREDGLHSPVLDIDFEAHIVPSSTSGHHHLYLDGIALSWWRYRILLWVLAWSGVIHKRYYRHSVRRRMTCVRMPHVKKPS